MIAATMETLPGIDAPPPEPHTLLEREWLVTNGLGGYASGTVSGACTRRYHGLLIAALPAPLGRTLMFNHLAEEVRFRDRTGVRLDTEDLSSPPESRGDLALRSFRLERRAACLALRDRLAAAGKTRAVAVSAKLRCLSSTDCSMPPVQCVCGCVPACISACTKRPSPGLCPDRIMWWPKGTASRFTTIWCRRCECWSSRRTPTWCLESGTVRQIRYLTEEARGYEYLGDLWNPGYFRAESGARRAGDARGQHRGLGHDSGRRAAPPRWRPICSAASG